MIVVGAKGLATELLDVFRQRNDLDGIFFFDNVSANAPERLFDRFPVLRSLHEVRSVFDKTGDKRFCLGLGGAAHRLRLAREFTEAGGILTSVISPLAHIAHYGTTLGEGCCVLPGAVITTNVSIGRGCLINPNATISHDSMLGDFVEVSPGANVPGNCQVGSYSFLGTNSAILPKVRIGSNVIVAAGAVVTRDVKNNCMVAGVPAIVKKELRPF